MKLIIYFIFLLLTLISCKKQQSDLKNEVNTITITDSKVIINDILITPINSKIKNQIFNIPEFKNLNDHIKLFTKITISKLENTTTSTIENLEDLQKSALPEQFTTKAVLSRINEVLTYCNLLNQKLKKNKRDIVLLSQDISKIITSYNHLATQINETTLDLYSDIEEELRPEESDSDALF